MRLDDPQDEMVAAVAEAAKAGPRSADRHRRWLEIVLDAEQAQRQWAIDELAAIQHAGAGARFKKHWKPEPKPVDIGGMTIDVQTVVGVQRDGEWQQLPMAEMTLGEMTTVVEERRAARDRSTRELVVLRRVKAFLDAQGAAPDATVGEVCAAASVSLDDVLAGVA